MRIFSSLLYIIPITACTCITANNEILENSKNQARQVLDHTSRQLQYMERVQQRDNKNTPHINTIRSSWNAYVEQQKDTLRGTSDAKSVSTIKGSVWVTQGLAEVAVEAPVHLHRKRSTSDDPCKLAIDIILLPWHVIDAIASPIGAIFSPHSRNPAPVAKNTQITAQQYTGLAYMMRNLHNAQDWLSKGIYDDITRKQQRSRDLDPMQEEPTLDIDVIDQQRQLAWDTTEKLLNKIRKNVHNGIDQLNNSNDIFRRYKENVDNMLTTKIKPYYLNKYHQDAIDKTYEVARMVYDDLPSAALGGRFGGMRDCNSNNIDDKPPQIPAHRHQKRTLREVVGLNA